MQRRIRDLERNAYSMTKKTYDMEKLEDDMRNTIVFMEQRICDL